MYTEVHDIVERGVELTRIRWLLVSTNGGVTMIMAVPRQGQLG